MRLFIMALVLALAPAAIAADGSVVVQCSITLTASQHAALVEEAKNLSTVAKPVTVESLCAEWLLQAASAHAETQIRNMVEQALAAEAAKPVEERPIEAAIKAAVAVKAAAVEAAKE